MRSVLLLLSSLAVAAAAVGQSQKPLHTFDSVPGKNPVEYCEGHPAKTADILTIDYVDLTPNPPTKGAALKIEASGKISEVVEEGAYAMISVKYGYIKIIETRQDLCEQVKNVDMECPLQPGDIKIVKEVQLPKEIPKGKYTVNADVYTKDEHHITCIVATVNFD